MCPDARHAQFSFLSVCVLIAFVVTCACDAMANPIEQQIYYQKEIAAFEALDAARPPQKGAVLFIGSSILRLWSTLEQDMRPIPVLNRAFGGARTWEVLHYMDRIVLPYEPRVIVYYCGSNDIHCGAEPQGIAQRFEEFVARVREKLPSARVVFISIIQSPQKRGKWNTIEETNRLIRTYCRSAPGVSFVDVNPVFFDNAHRPRAELYAEDGLHLRPEAYREMTRVIKPVLENVWRDNGDDNAR